MSLAFQHRVAFIGWVAMKEAILTIDNARIRGTVLMDWCCSKETMRHALGTETYMCHTCGITHVRLKGGSIMSQI